MTGSGCASSVTLNDIIVHWGYIGIMEKKMETIGFTSGLYKGYIGIIGSTVTSTYMTGAFMQQHSGHSG